MSLLSPRIAANMRGLNLGLAADEPAFVATSSPTAMPTHMQCIQSPEAWTVRKKLDYSLILTHSVHFKQDHMGYIWLSYELQL